MGEELSEFFEYIGLPLTAIEGLSSERTGLVRHEDVGIVHGVENDRCGALLSLVPNRLVACDVITNKLSEA